MSRAVSPSANRPYGILRVTRIWGTARATLYRHRGQRDDPGARRRPGPLRHDHGSQFLAHDYQPELVVFLGIES